MKNKLLSIGLLFTFLFTFIPLNETKAETEDAFIDCEKLQTEFEDSLPVWEEKDRKSHNEFDLMLEKTQKAYHDYMSCLFGTAFDHVLKEEGKSTKKTKGELSAQINSINWMLPGQACISEDELIQSIEGSSPEKLLTKALNASDQYMIFLNQMNIALRKNIYLGKDIPKAISNRGNTNIQKLNLLVKEREIMIINEVKSSATALDISLTALKELRFSFVAHVRFQCILHNLGAYQKLLAKLRRITEALPPALQNASVNP